MRDFLDMTPQRDVDVDRRGSSGGGMESGYLRGARHDVFRWRRASGAQDHVCARDAPSVEPDIIRRGDVERDGRIAGGAGADECLPAIVERKAAIGAL